jgi:hypothetical protein
MVERIRLLAPEPEEPEPHKRLVFRVLGDCAECGRGGLKFYSLDSWREFAISQLCSRCQSRAFGKG